jgi:hypothetical protein
MPKRNESRFRMLIIPLIAYEAAFCFNRVFVQFWKHCKPMVVHFVSNDIAAWAMSVNHFSAISIYTTKSPVKLREK